jgi:hypothetical protein
MTNEQPEALRLADLIQSDFDPDWMIELGYDQIAAELRRLHELHVLYQDKVQRLEDAVKLERNRIWTQAHWTEYERSIAAVERKRLHDKFMKIHKSQQHSNNYWHFAARKIMEEPDAA